MEKRHGTIFIHYPPSVLDQREHPMRLKELLEQLDMQIIVELLKNQLLPLEKASFPIIRIAKSREFGKEANILVEVKSHTIDRYVFNWKTFRINRINV